jgi:surface antigen
MREIMHKVLLFLSAMLLTSILHAASPGFLHDVSPISDFTPEDSTLFWDAITNALDTKKDGEKLAWQNEKSGNSGLVNPLNSYEESGNTCRDLRIVNRSKKHIAESKYKFCKQDGKWVAITMIK